ncbi:MAG TPA: PKD domain-containing protein [Vicinamibacteria bacterium]|nr:PKD domain-containing protein [Vicinamibacteria bacterium]
MRCGSAVVPLLVLALATPVLAGPRANKPRFDLRATPRIAFSPVSVLVVAELNGGDELEEFHCPGLEWDWGDGARSAHEADCEPFEPGTTLERRFSARHVFRRAGEYDVKVTLRRAERSLAVAPVRVTVHGLSASFE